MLQFLSVYGGTILASIVSTILLSLMKKYMSNQKKQQQEHDKELMRQMQEEMKSAVAEERDRAVEKNMEVRAQLEINDAKLENLTKGILSMQGKQFRADCRELLKPDHTLTQDEFLEISNDHEAYNALGGNHTGDLLFDAVRKKFNAPFGTNH